jgi:hypothetical protein
MMTVGRKGARNQEGVTWRQLAANYWTGPASEANTSHCEAILGFYRARRLVKVSKKNLIYN